MLWCLHARCCGLKSLTSANSLSHSVDARRCTGFDLTIAGETAGRGGGHLICRGSFSELWVWAYGLWGCRLCGSGCAVQVVRCRLCGAGCVVPAVRLCRRRLWGVHVVGCAGCGVCRLWGVQAVGCAGFGGCRLCSAVFSPASLKGWLVGWQYAAQAVTCMTRSVVMPGDAPAVMRRR